MCDGPTRNVACTPASSQICPEPTWLISYFQKAPETLSWAVADCEISSPTNNTREIRGELILAGALLYRMHYIASQLQYAGSVQLGLFDPPADRDEAIGRLKRESGAKHGRFAVRSAATLPLAEIYRDDAHSYEICDVHGKTCF